MSFIPLPVALAPPVNDILYEAAEAAGTECTISTTTTTATLRLDESERALEEEAEGAAPDQRLGRARATSHGAAAADVAAIAAMASEMAEHTAEAVAEAAVEAAGETLGDALRPLDEEGHPLPLDAEGHPISHPRPSETAGEEGLRPETPVTPLSPAEAAVPLDLVPEGDITAPETTTTAPTAEPRRVLSLDQAMDAFPVVQLAPTTLGEAQHAHAAEADVHAETAAAMAAMAVDMAMHEGAMLGSAATTAHGLEAAGLEAGLPFEPLDTIAESQLPATVVVKEEVGEERAETETEPEEAEATDEEAGEHGNDEVAAGRAAMLARAMLQSRRHHAEAPADGGELPPHERRRSVLRTRNVSTRSTRSMRSLHSLDSTGTPASQESLTAVRFAPVGDELHGSDLVPEGVAVPDALEDAVVTASVLEQAPVILHEGVVPHRPTTETYSAEHSQTTVTTTGATLSTPLARTVIVTTTTTTVTEAEPESSTTEPMVPPGEEPHGEQAAISTTTTTVVTFPKPLPSTTRPMLITLMVAMTPLAVG